MSGTGGALSNARESHTRMPLHLVSQLDDVLSAARDTFDAFRPAFDEGTLPPAQHKALIRLRGALAPLGEVR